MLNDPLKHIWVCRHPPTQSEGLCVGQHPVPISISWAQAKNHVLQKAPIHPTEIWTSDLPRCLELANLCAVEWELTVNVSSNLREISMGSWQGKRYDDLQKNDTTRWNHWCDDWKNNIPPNGENLEMLQRRIQQWLQQTAFTEKPVLIAHAGVVRTLRVLGGQCWEQAMSTPVVHLEWEQIGVYNEQ